MKTFLVTMLALTACLRASAQVSVDLGLDQEQFLPNEAVKLAVDFPQLHCCDTFNFSRFMAGEVGNVCIPGGETCFPSIFSSLLGMRLDLWSLALCCRRRLLADAALLLPIDLLAQVANQDGPHAGVAVQQDLQVLVSQEGDLAAHVVEQTFHVVQIGAHLRQIVVRFARRWPRRGLRRSVCLTLPALGRRTELPASALCP